MAMEWKSGSCHCDAVQWQAQLPDDVVAHECNCSICEMVGFLHVIAPRSKFRIIQGTEHIAEYTFNTGVAKHMFCKICGVKSFYVPRSNPDGYSLNLRCMDRQQFQTVVIEPLDGKNWEENAGKLAHLSRDS